MEKREADSYMPVYILFTTASGLLWLGLIGLKAIDGVSMNWIAVLLGVWWIPMFILAMNAALAVVMVAALHIKRTIRKWKVKRREKREETAEKKDCWTCEYLAKKDRHSAFWCRRFPRWSVVDDILEQGCGEHKEAKEGETYK